MMVVLVYSVTPISNIIEQNIIWLHEVKYSPVQKGVFFPPASVLKLLALHNLYVYQKRNKNGCCPRSVNFNEFLTVHLSWLVQL